MSKHHEKPRVLIDTLHLSEERWRELSDKLDRLVTHGEGQRRHQRLPYRKLAQIAVAIQDVDGQWATYVVRSRNLSAGGIGFIHGSYVHTGSCCRVILKDKQAIPVCLEGTVRHCVLVDGNVHCVGVQFKEEVNIGRFMVDDRADVPDPKPEG